MDSELQPPAYTIHRSKGGSYVWNPPEGSLELEQALAYHFPGVKGKFKMIAARVKFIQNEAKTATVARKMHATLHSNENASIANQLTMPSFHTSILDSKTMTAAEERPKRNTGGEIEKSEVYLNRNMTCDNHKQQRKKCDPNVCPENKLYKARRPDYIDPSVPRSSLGFYDKGNPTTPDPEEHRASSEYTLSSEYALGSDRKYARQHTMNRTNEAGKRSDDGNGGGEGGPSEPRFEDDSGDYGDYWKGVDDDSQGTSGPFGGGNEPSGGGYPRPSGGYYVFPLKKKYGGYSDGEVLQMPPRSTLEVVTPPIYARSSAEEWISDDLTQNSVDIETALGELKLN